MESLAECLATQDLMRERFEVLRQTLSEPLLSEVEDLKNLAIHSLEEKAVSIEAGEDSTNESLRFPQIFNALYQLLETSDFSEALNEAELCYLASLSESLNEAELCYLASLSESLNEAELCYLASLSIPRKFLSGLFKIAILNEYPKLEEILLTANHSLKINPDWLLGAVKTRNKSVIRRICDVCDYITISRARASACEEIDKYLCDRLFKRQNSWIENTPITLSLGREIFYPHHKN
jgi:hypothetical protein